MNISFYFQESLDLIATATWQYQKISFIFRLLKYKNWNWIRNKKETRKRRNRLLFPKEAFKMAIIIKKSLFSVNNGSLRINRCFLNWISFHVVYFDCQFYYLYHFECTIWNSNFPSVHCPRFWCNFQIKN